MADCVTTIAAVGLHIASWHADPGFNNINPGGLIRSDCEVLFGQPQVGAFYNSEENFSAYAGLAFELDREADVSPYLLVGGVTGYDDFTVAPLANVGLRFGPFDDDVPVALLVGYTPEVSGKGSHLVHFALEWRF